MALPGAAASVMLRFRDSAEVIAMDTVLTKRDRIRIMRSVCTVRRFPTE